MYQHDDGTFEAQNGNAFSGLKSLLGIHQDDVLMGANVITEVRVAWPGSGLVTGDAASVVLWSDPNLDGNPNDAQVLVSVPTTIQLGGTGNFVSIDIPDTLVGNSFFVGTLIEKDSTTFTAGRMVDNSAPSSGKVWSVGFLGRSADLNDLSSGNFFSHITDREFGIRAVGVPEPNALSMLLLGSSILLTRSRLRSRP